MEISRKTEAFVAEERTATLFVALELSKTRWLVAVESPALNRVSRHTVTAGDAKALVDLITRLRLQAETKLGQIVRVVSCFEAGYDGFWLHRYLEAVGIINYVIEPASLQVNRRARRIKTDAIDLEALLRALIGYDRGDQRICRMVHVPSLEDEDAKRLHRERQRLVKERIGHVNRIKGLLATQGISRYEPLRVGRREQLQRLLTAGGQALPQQLYQELDRELRRLELVLEQLQVVESERDAVACRADPKDARERMIGRLMRLRGIGPEIATVLVREMFYRDFANRRQVASLAGLTPSPYASGGMMRDQGISKAGNPRVRSLMVQLAWLWTRHQPGSALSRWFAARVGAMRGRIRRITIVALARKLLTALWRYVTVGLVPTDSEMKPGYAD
jgi:transposase